MEKKQINYRVITIVVLLVSILFMSIGYAIKSSNLTINGSTTIENAKWDVHLANVVESNGIVGSEFVFTPARIVDRDGTYIVYDVKLPTKGDFYEFSFDVVNEGTIDARLSSLVQFGSDDYDKYIHYSLKYKEGNGVYGNDVLKAGERKTLVLRVENIYDGTENVDEVFNLSFMIQYVQK